jgi:hypothetical protein
MTFDETQKLLNTTFDGFIENQSETAAFKFKQISIAVDESKEAIGAALLPVVKELADFLIVSVVPAIESFVAGLTGEDSLAEGLTESQKKAVEWGNNVRKVIDTVIDLKDELIAVAVVIGTVFVVSKIAAGVTATIALIKSLITAYNLLKTTAIVTGVATAFALNPLLGVGAVALAAGVLAAANALANKSGGETTFATGGAPGFITGGSGNSGTYTKEETKLIAAAQGVENARKAAADAAMGLKGASGSNAFAGLGLGTAGGTINSSDYSQRNAGMASINLTVNGAIDAEGTARTIVKTLNDSFYRGTGGASALQAI